MLVSKVCGCYYVIYLKWTPIFEWCVVRCKSKNGHHKATCLKEIELCLLCLLIILHIILVEHALHTTITKIGEVQFSLQFLLLCHHKFVNFNTNFD
jgi:hypothetical protein